MSKGREKPTDVFICESWLFDGKVEWDASSYTEVEFVLVREMMSFAPYERVI